MEVSNLLMGCRYQNGVSKYESLGFRYFSFVPSRLYDPLSILSKIFCKHLRVYLVLWNVLNLLLGKS